MVAEAQRSRAPIQRLADRVAAWFVPAVIGVAVVAFVVWATVGPDPQAGPRPDRGGLRPDHRLPVCARAGHADVDHGRRGPRRPARRAHQERRGARADGEGRHPRRRQDRHPDRGQAVGHPRRPVARVRRRGAAAARRRRRARLRAPAGPCRRGRRRARPGWRPGRRPTSTPRPARAPSAPSRHRRSCSAAPTSCSPGHRHVRRSPCEADGLRGRRRHRGLRRRRRPGRWASSPSPTRSRTPPPPRSQPLREEGIEVVMLTGDNRVTAEAVGAAPGHRPRRGRGAARPQERRRQAAPRRGPGRGDGRRRRQRRPCPGRRRRRAGDELGHRRGHRERRRHPARAAT